MIRFKFGDDLIEFDGTMDVTPQVKYLFEKKNPFVPNQPYRHGKHYVDRLKVSILARAEDYEDLYYLALGSEHYYISWETFTGFQYRKISQKLPYPSQIRFLDGKVEFSLESEPYAAINPNMENITRNMRWNISTIANTILN